MRGKCLEPYVVEVQRGVAHFNHSVQAVQLQTRPLACADVGDRYLDDGASIVEVVDGDVYVVGIDIIHAQTIARAA